LFHVLAAELADNPVAAVAARGAGAGEVAGEAAVVEPAALGEAGEQRLDVGRVEGALAELLPELVEGVGAESEGAGGVGVEPFRIQPANRAAGRARSPRAVPTC